MPHSDHTEGARCPTCAGARAAFAGDRACDLPFSREAVLDWARARKAARDAA